MSDRTPNSPEGLNGSEPSMEDILASIRKIISDDEPVALGSPEDLPAVSLVEKPVADDLVNLMQDFDLEAEDLTSDAVLDAAFSIPETVSSEGGSVDLNIDDVLAGLDDDILGGSPEIASEITPEIASEITPEIAPEAAFDAGTGQADPGDALSAIFDDLSAEAAPETVENLASGSDVIEAESNIFADDDDILSLLSDDLSFNDELTSLDTAEAVAADVEIGDVEITPPAFEQHIAPLEVPDLLTENLTVGDDSEMDSLLDDILLSPEGADTVIEDIQLGDEDLADSEDLDFEVPLEEDVMAELSGEQDLSDLDLVKSLMADLSDDAGDIEAEDDLEALLAIPEVGGDAAVLADLEAFTASEPEASVVNDILDMTIEDELKSFPDVAPAADDFTSLEDVLGAEQDNIIENALPLEDVSLGGILASDEAGVELPSLSDIAAAAEADAVAVETIQAPHAIAATAGLAAALGGAVLTNNALASNVEAAAVQSVSGVEVEPNQIDEVAQIDEVVEIFESPEVSETHVAVSETPIEQTPVIISNQETSMPVKAVKTDAILDDVTEAATAGAFAELNQVVEDKAVFNERGPRIGDLVQDALRPMIKEWLDANLKGIVERAVTKEVKRISSGK